MKKISIIGLNPAWQKVLAFTDFQKNTVNRAVTVSAMASGKGINAARAARCWNQTIPCVFQFAGGTSGQNILEYLNREGISHCTGEIPEQTRTCTT